MLPGHPCGFEIQVSGFDKEVPAAKQGRRRPGIQKRFLVLRLRERVKIHFQFLHWGCLHGGKTCAESPHRITRPCAQMLQLRAENVKGRERMTLIQFSGN